MTSDVTGVTGRASDFLARSGLDATYQHVVLLRDKQAALHAAQIAAEEQLLHRVGVLYEAGEVDDDGLVALYEAFAAVALPKYTMRWNAAISFTAARLQSHRAHLRYLERHAPNMPDGTWRGTWPLGDGGTPADLVPVVYVLYDGDSEPCYVGSTERLRPRLQQHERDGKPFVHWTACRCDDREAAYQLEDRLLAEYKPYLNKRRGRLWAPGSSPSP